MLIIFVLLVCLGSTSVSANEFVNYYEVLGVDRKAKSSAIKTAFRTLALKMHPDKVGNTEEAMAAYVVLNDAYTALKSADSRADFDEELDYFTKYGRMRHMLRYRVYPKTNVWAVAIGFLLITNTIHYYLLVSDHKYHLRMVRFTPEYQKALKDMMKQNKASKMTEEQAHEALAPEVKIQNSGPPYYPQLWLYRLTRGCITAPYNIFMFFWTYRDNLNKLKEQEAEALEQYKKMTKQEKARYRKRFAKHYRGH